MLIHTGIDQDFKLTSHKYRACHLKCNPNNNRVLHCTSHVRDSPISLCDTRVAQRRNVNDENCWIMNWMDLGGGSQPWPNYGIIRAFIFMLHAPAALNPGKRPLCPLGKSLGWSHSRSEHYGEQKKTSCCESNPGIQPVARRYTDWAAPAHKI